MIEKIYAIDRNNNTNEFIVTQEPLLETGLNGKEYTGIRYMISVPGSRPFRHFEFSIIDISDTRIMIFMILDNGIPEVSGKGITKAMIKALSVETKKDIVSSTNYSTHKLFYGEGRVKSADDAWKKWCDEIPNVSRIPEEGRYIFKYVKEGD